MIQAIMDRVFVQLPPEDNTTSGGIILASSKKNPQNIGIVISIGEKVDSIKVGDKVIFHAFDELEVDDNNVVAIRQNSILGVIIDE